MADTDDTRASIAAGIIGGVAALAAGYAARKILTVAWTRTTGKEPPSEPESPEVRLSDALAWAALTGIGVEVARVLAVRATRRRLLGATPHDVGGDRISTATT